MLSSALSLKATGKALGILAIASTIVPPLHAAISQVKLTASPSSPQLLGTTIQLTASAEDSDPGPVTYKWEIEPPRFSHFSLIRDFALNKTLAWTPNYVEGTYQLRVTARDYLAGTSARQVISFQVKALVSGSQPVATATANPLVALFSVPTCPAGSTMAVTFQAQSSSTSSTTDWRSCHAGSMNFYIAGIAANQTYLMTYQVNTGGTITYGPPVAFTTAAIPSSLMFPPMSVPLAPGPLSGLTDPVVLTGYANAPNFPTATDLAANIIWYYPETVQLTRPVPGGTMLAIGNGPGTGTGVWGDTTKQQLVREFDLAGNIVRETNCDRVYEQLVALGLRDPLGRFNHDAIRLSNGQTIVLADVQRIFPAGTQGFANSLDIVGALIVVLDQNFQVTGYWSAFDHICNGASSGCLDINRAGDTSCPARSDSPGGCPPVLLSSPANDWLHANSLEYLTGDGDLLVSLRNQNWVIKIDYNGGSGTGDVIWRLGLDGDFALSGTAGGSYPWFSGQHDAGFVNGAERTLALFDNGTTRHQSQGGYSRGQVWSIDQTSMSASLELNTDLRAYSYALGSAQLLGNGDYMFLAGSIQLGGSVEVQNTEVTLKGAEVYQFQSIGPAPAYRGWRLPDLYHATLDGSAGPE